MNIPKTCILCKSMEFDGGEPHYSEYTPGSNWSSCCVKDHWEMSGTALSNEEYRLNLMMAEGCPDFEMVEKTDGPT